MKPEQRVRKKVEVFNPHPPGTKHQMMAERTRKVKDSKQKVENKIKNRDRMRVTREKEKDHETTQKGKNLEKKSQKKKKD